MVKRRDPSSIPGLRRSPGAGTSNPLQNSCLENSMDREAWWAIVHGATKSEHARAQHTVEVKSQSEMVLDLCTKSKGSK